MLRRITDWISRRKLKYASQGLAMDFGVPQHIASQIIQDTMAALGQLDLDTASGSDILVVMRTAAVEIAQLSAGPMDDEIAGYCSALEEPHRSIMTGYRQGMSIAEIALSTGLTADAIRWSLSKGHAAIRMQLPSATGAAPSTPQPHTAG